MDGLRVYILTEGSSSIGFGHVTRCLSLYQAFEERGIKPKFIVNGDKSIVELLKGTNYEIVNWLKEQQKIFKIVKDSDIVVVDSYLTDKNFHENLSKLVKLPVYIDDNKRIDYPKGVVVNGNIHAEGLNYPRRKEVIYLLGTKYIPLRKEFWEVPEKEIRKTIQSVMVTFGGDDIKKMTPKVLKLLNENYPELKKNVIIGKGFHNVDEIKTVADENTNLIYYPNAEEIKQAMLDYDIAISAGGQTLYELARVGVPTIAVAVADNQLKNVKGWEKTGFIEYTGWWKDKYVLDNIIFSIEKLKGFDVRLNRYIIGRRLVDGIGSLRNISKVLKILINKELIFREVKERDIWDIYEISNDNTVRQVSFNSNHIDKEEHKRWFANNYRNNFYVIVFRRKVIGQIRFSVKSENNEAIVSISLHRNYRQLGLGKFLLKKGLKKFLEGNKSITKIIALIKKSNYKSKSLFESVGFEKAENNGEWFRYELTRDKHEGI
ncbi:pseudaminic acid biosynthesis-associated protein PseG [Thermodesulfatator indicus DSM 15286]|uniref:Pseudaminic acid biosynthesis-associated protein PseG n=1 Tax=Thermodesulfatator indicus (strain DSM 15286 / JCM 11887 / CIR29812) TaxID=667014 RepID=F8AAQ5_THEID|nr:pseudaminic acid biosynthesis-associated protein PseG [Thermodesulfatator indicus DSM 15286]